MGCRATSLICCLSLLLSPVAAPVTYAAETEPGQRPAVERKAQRAWDVTIAKDGSVIGRLVNASGNPQPNAKLIARRSDQQPVAVKTDEKGNFRLPGVRAGVYSIAYGDRSLLLRVWDAEVAPPAAKPGVLLVNGDVERGQLAGLNPLASSFTAQAFAIGILAAAVAVPIAIGLDEPSGS